MTNAARPPALRIIANLAMSADGKIDSHLREGAGFSSRGDRERMDVLRAAADAVVVGAGTVRTEDPPLRVRDPARRRRRVAEGRAEDLAVVVVSASGLVSPDARFLREPADERILAVPEDLPEAPLRPLAAHFASGALRLLRLGRGAVDVAALAARLAAEGRRTILVEGGGELVARFVAADLLDELRLTLCPTVIGGRTAPTPVGGDGWPLAARRRLELLEVERAGDELFLRYAFRPLSVDPAAASPQE